MYDRFESSFMGYLDCELFYQAWVPKEPKALLIITHGQGEHSGSYHRVVNALGELSLKIIAWDLRGHGRSTGKRGVAHDFADYSRDLEALHQTLTEDKTNKKLPLFFLSHSMGGLIQLKFLMSQNSLTARAQVLSAPLLGLSVQVPVIKEIAAQAMALIAPEVTLGNEIRDEDLSRDSTVLKEYQADFFRHRRISSGAYLGILNTMKLVNEHPQKISLPTLLQISDQDPVVSTAAALAFGGSLPSGNCEVHSYPGMKHEIYNDKGRELVFKDLKKYLNSYLD